MGYKLQIDREGRLARLWLFGKTSVEEQRQWLDNLVNHPDWSPAFNMLIDVRGLVDSGFDYERMRAVAKHIHRLNEQLGAGRHAVVGDTDVLYGYARMAEQMCFGCLRELVVFRDMQSAERWLGIHEEQPSLQSRIRHRQARGQPGAEEAGGGEKL